MISWHGLHFWSLWSPPRVIHCPSKETKATTDKGSWFLSTLCVSFYYEVHVYIPSLCVLCISTCEPRLSQHFEQFKISTCEPRLTQHLCEPRWTQHFEQFKISTCEPAFWTIQDINMWAKINPAFWIIQDIRIFSFLSAAISNFSPKILGLLYTVIIKCIKRARYITILAYNIYFIF